MDDFDVLSYTAITTTLKDLLECRMMMLDAGIDTTMMDQTIQKENYVVAVSIDNTYRETEALYNKEQAKEKLSVVKSIK